ncbi:MAG TPA: phosphoglucosamine mutase [Proteobacteria bacterium]|nr:phosphoglucosamine mutase [Pseudomonadota bacterium]
MTNDAELPPTAHRSEAEIPPTAGLPTKLFGTDGIRGEAGKYPIIPEMVVKIGQAVAATVKADDGGRIIIGHDGRLSASMIEDALVEGICSMGVDAILTGLIPTPAIAFLTRSMKMGAGIVISASHNPFQDNGIKIFSSGGSKLEEEVEAGIEALVHSPSFPGDLTGLERRGKSSRLEDGSESYLEFLRGTVPENFTLEGLSIVLDCSNGATSLVGPEIFSRLGARVTTLFASPDGRNINSGCGSQHPEVLAREVIKIRADIGLAFDGDGDRMIAVDEKGELITGDRIIFICGSKMKRDNRLPHDMVVCTVMSNLGLHHALSISGIKREITDVGDRYVMERMKATGSVLGGEDSGHLIFLDQHTTGDGIISALQLLLTIKDEGRPLSELGSGMTVLPQLLLNVPVREKPDLSTIPEIADEIKAVEAELGDSGRVLVRYSGTQLLCRVMVEGPTVEITEKYCERIAEVIKSQISSTK